MWIIRSTQMAALEQAMDDDLRRRLLAYLGALTGRADDGAVDSLLAQCRRVGLARESEIARYLEIVAGQPWFARREWPPIPVMRALTQFGKPASDRLAAVAAAIASAPAAP